MLPSLQPGVGSRTAYHCHVRVAFVAECFLPSLNGVTNSVLRVLEHLGHEGHQALVIAPDDPRGVPTQYAGFPVVTTPSFTLPWYPDLRVSMTSKHHLTTQLKVFAPDVVHLAAPVVLGHKGVLAAAALGIPSIALYQTDIPNYLGQYGYSLTEPLFWHHLRSLHNMATINLAPSTWTHDELMGHGFSRLAIWGRGVDTVRFTPAKRDERLHAAWAPNGEIVVGYMGRLGSEKQVSDLTALSGIPGVRMVIVGDGPERAKLEKAIPQAVFTGVRTGEDLPRHLASMDLFVHPGEMETFGQAIQEAQASGLPVIAPRRGGPVDLVSPSHNGWLYAPGDLTDMRAKVIDLVGDGYKRAAFGRTARSMVQHRSWPQVCDQLLDHYATAIELGVRLPARIA
ncbi:hypothetical protein HMPREF1531_01649 [Propionibacterium sp. oral taxon 192 str. F0372]|nr:hypothetical protein HMPREF1531_01649 [Propionibacterium sp. oral taxon 192 str. F0372]